MIGFPSNTCLAILMLSTLELCVVSQDFCESYKKSDYSVIIWSHSNDSFLLIIDKHFWRLWEVNSKLVFDRKDFQASNSSDQWTENNYKFANVVYDLNDTKYRGIVLIKDMNYIDNKQLTPFRRDYYDFHGNHFSGVKNQETFDYTTLHHKRVSFSIPEEQLEYEVIQFFTDKTKQMLIKTKIVQAKRTYDQAKGYIYSFYYFVKGSQNDGIRSQVERLKNFTDLLIIGSYLSSQNKIICFFRIEDDIKYCTIDECIREEYKTLISCVTEINWIPLTIVVIISVLLVIVISVSFVVYYCMRSHRTEQKFSENTNRTFMDYSTDNTLQSISSSSVSSGSKSTTNSPPKTTTLTKTKPVAKKVSPIKQQKLTTPAKGKAKMKPKKSPQLKK